MQTWRMHPDGSGSERIPETGYVVLDETDEGRGLLCRNEGKPGIWVISGEDGAARQIVPGKVARTWTDVAALEQGLYHISQGNARATLGFYDYATARVDSLLAFDRFCGSLAVSPDHTRLLYECVNQVEIDLMMVDRIP